MVPNCRAGTLDLIDIDTGGSLDNNNNGVPDECECPTHLDGDGDVDAGDLAQLLGNWGPNPATPPTSTATEPSTPRTSRCCWVTGGRAPDHTSVGGKPERSYPVPRSKPTLTESSLQEP